MSPASTPAAIVESAFLLPSRIEGQFYQIDLAKPIDEQREPSHGQLRGPAIPRMSNGRPFPSVSHNTKTRRSHSQRKRR